MATSTGEMKSDAQISCDIVRGVPQAQPFVDHSSFEMNRYISQPSEMSRGHFQSYDMPMNVGHSFDIIRAPVNDTPKSIPQSFQMSRGIQQNFDMCKGENQFDISRNARNSFEMQRGHDYEMIKTSKNYDLPYNDQPYEMPRETIQPYEMTRSMSQVPEMGMVHPCNNEKECNPCPEAQQNMLFKNNQQHMPNAHHILEVPMEMPKTAPQPSAKANSPSFAKSNSHPIDFAKDYAQQLEIAKKAAQTAIEARIETKKAEKVRQKADVERARHESEEAERGRREMEKKERAKSVTQPSEILKLYAQQLEMMKKPAQSSKLAKMYARQLETVRVASKKKKNCFNRDVNPHDRKNGSQNPESNDRETVPSNRLPSPKPEEMETEAENRKLADKLEGDPPPFEMAKYLAQLSKMVKGGKSSTKIAKGDAAWTEDKNKCETQLDDEFATDKAPEESKSTGLSFSFELIKNLGLPLEIGIPGAGGATKTKRDRQELTIANKARLIVQVESRGTKKKADIAREWGLRPSTLSTIMKNRERILTQCKSQRYAANRRRMRTAAYPDVEEALLTWFRYARAANIPITGPILQGMGVTLAQELGHPEFSCSVGWLDRFKARHGLIFNPKNSQDMVTGTFNEPEDRVSSLTKAIPAEEGPENSDLCHPPLMPGIGPTCTVSIDVANSPDSLQNTNSISVTESQDQLKKWFPATLSNEPQEEEESRVPEDSEIWFQTMVPALLNEYKPCDIYSAGEAALFYNLLPDRSLTMKQECHKWTWVKERLTMMVAVNMDGSDKLPLQVIGQMKDPKAIYDIEALPMPYEANESAMMTATLFEGWVRRLDKQYQNLNRNIIILVDACPAHPYVNNLSNVKLFFLPQDTKCKVQPVEQGIIQKIKALYRRFILERVIEYSIKKRGYEITLFEAMELLQDAWKDIEPDLIRNCFKRVGLEPLKEHNNTKCFLGEDEYSLFERARCAGLDIPLEVTFEAYLNVDSQVQTTIEQDEDLPHDNTLKSNGSNSGFTFPGEAMQCLATLRKFVQEQGGANKFLKHLTDMEVWVAKRVVKPEVLFVSE